MVKSTLAPGYRGDNSIFTLTITCGVVRKTAAFLPCIRLIRKMVNVRYSTIVSYVIHLCFSIRPRTCFETLDRWQSRNKDERLKQTRDFMLTIIFDVVFMDESVLCD